jgi:hypothetical protein
VSSAASLARLEEDLSALSHDESPLKVVQDFAKSLGKRERQDVFNGPGVLVRPAIRPEDASGVGLEVAQRDAFVLLQGDLIVTEAAYFLGERLTGTQKFAVANSTCDVMPNRRENAVLFHLQPIRASEPNAKQLLGELLAFGSTRRMYLPALPGDPSDSPCNALNFDGVAQIQTCNLLTATRVASLGLVGWRILASMIRTNLCRITDFEIELRNRLWPGQRGVLASRG